MPQGIETGGITVSFKLGRVIVCLSFCLSLVLVGCPRPAPGENKYVYIVNMAEGDMIAAYAVADIANYPGPNLLQFPIGPVTWVSKRVDGAEQVSMGSVIDLYDERGQQIHEAFEEGILTNQTVVMWIFDPEDYGSPSDPNYDPINTYSFVERYDSDEWLFILALITGSKSELELRNYLESAR